jgi:hypothetical protein
VLVFRRGECENALQSWPAACVMRERPNRAQLDLGGLQMAKKKPTSVAHAHRKPTKKLKKAKKLSGAKTLFRPA